MSITSTGRKHSEKTKDKISITKTGRKHSEETKNKISATTTGRKRKPHSDATRKKIGDGNRGKTVSLETIAKRLETKKTNKMFESFISIPETPRDIARSRSASSESTASSR